MRPNAWVAVSAIVFGTAYGIQAFNIPKAPIGNPMGPLYFPLALAGLMIFFGAISLFIEARKGLNSDDREKRPKFRYQNMRLIIIVTALCLLYTALFDFLGFTISTVLFMVATLKFVNDKGSVRMNTIISVVYSLALWYVFVRIFGIVLPTSPLGFI